MVEVIKTRGTKKCITKQRLKFGGYKIFSENSQIRLRSQQRFKKEVYNVFIEQVNKIVLSFSDDKRLIKDYNDLMKQSHMRMKQLQEKCAKKNWQKIYKKKE